MKYANPDSHTSQYTYQTPRKKRKKNVQLFAK